MVGERAGEDLTRPSEVPLVYEVARDELFEKADTRRSLARRPAIIAQPGRVEQVAVVHAQQVVVENGARSVQGCYVLGELERMEEKRETQRRVGPRQHMLD